MLLCTQYSAVAHKRVVFKINKQNQIRTSYNNNIDVALICT